MKRSDKNLLIKILSLMLRYGVMCQVDGLEKPQKLMGIEIVDGNVLFKFLRKQCHGRKAFIHCTIDRIKPYLRDASTLTAEELTESSKSREKTTWSLKHFLCPTNLTDKHEPIAIINIFDNGLAIRAPKGMYKGY